MPYGFDDAPSADARPLRPLCADDLDPWLAARDARTRRWVEATGFEARPGTVCLLPDAEGGIAEALAGVETPGAPWDHAAAAGRLPAGPWRLETRHLGERWDADAARRACLGWALADYRFDRYRSRNTDAPRPRLAWPEGVDRAAVEHAAEAIYLVRDLINTPAGDMGPGELAEAARGLADAFGGRLRVIEGDALLAENFPAIHAVGRASARPPRLIDLTWGDESAPRLTLVGKGVCFDTGGLDLKPASAMKLMKKDMGGAAHVLGLARMVMAARLPVRLRVLVPAVENSVAGNALYPLDVVPTRKGLTVEIGHTDAEGRVILADALAEADAEAPDLVIDVATLTGAARVALGTELPALFTNDESVAGALLGHGRAEADELWRLPLWAPYRRHMDSQVADISNDSSVPYGGAITAGLFLKEFVSDATPWVHIDVMAWNTSSRPGRPEGGEAMGLRALFAFLSDRYGS